MLLTGEHKEMLARTDGVTHKPTPTDRQGGQPALTWPKLVTGNTPGQDCLLSVKPVFGLVKYS